MKIKLEFEIEPQEVVDFLQRLSEHTGSHHEGLNSKVDIGEKVLAVLKKTNGEEKRHVV